jgi:glutathione S-transferase
VIQLYTLPPSGNAQKVRMALCFLDLPFEEMSLAGGGQKTPAFQAINPLGQVPVLVDGATTLRDSGAILVYLAAAYRPGEWDGHDAGERGRIAQWLMFAAGEIAGGPVRLRAKALFGATIDDAAATVLTGQVLDLVEAQLAERNWLEGERLTIADLAVAPYLALSPQGGVDLDPFPNIRAWLERIVARPGFPAMPGWAGSTALAS